MWIETMYILYYCIHHYDCYAAYVEIMLHVSSVSHNYILPVYLKLRAGSDNLHEFLHLPFLLSETLSQLHGTGLYFKKSLGGSKGVLEKFPNIEEQIQIRKFAQHIFITDIIIHDTF